MNYFTSIEKKKTAIAELAITIVFEIMTVALLVLFERNFKNSFSYKFVINEYYNDFFIWFFGPSISQGLLWFGWQGFHSFMNFPLKRQLILLYRYFKNLSPNSGLAAKMAYIVTNAHVEVFFFIHQRFDFRCDSDKESW